MYIVIVCVKMNDIQHLIISKYTLLMNSEQHISLIKTASGGKLRHWEGLQNSDSPLSEETPQCGSTGAKNNTVNEEDKIRITTYNKLIRE